MHVIPIISCRLSYHTDDYETKNDHKQCTLCFLEPHWVRQSPGQSAVDCMLVTRGLHGDGNCGNAVEPMGIVWRWKQMLQDSRGVEQNCAGFPWECSSIWLLWCTCSNKNLFSNCWIINVFSDYTKTNCIVIS